jgi:c-di-GMP-binding flagellar brake protein YcgR
MQTHDSERREFVRMRANLAVRYKFLSNSGEEIDSETHEGITRNLSGGGLLLEGKVPNAQWIPDLLMQRIVVGVNLLLPDGNEPVKALTRVAWVEAFDETASKCAMGLMFREITREHQDMIFRYVIKCQMP